MTIQVGLYARISDDPTDSHAGVNCQLADSRRICDIRGWTPAPEPYEDNDISAYKRGVVRPEFERLLDDLRSGRIDGIVVYDLDRIARQPRDLERIIDVYEERPGLVFASAQGSVDLSSTDGQSLARVVVTFANKASADTSRRVARKHLELAEQGIPVGGTRPFGWQADKRTLHPVEADLVREAVDRVVGGLATRSLARDWNDAGITTTRGKQWSGKTVTQYLRSPRLVGLRTYKKTVMLDEAGRPVVGQWEPMLTTEEFDSLVAALAHDESRSRIPRKGSHHFLLSGLATCGICAAPMYGSKRNDKYWYYVCGDTEGHSLSVSGPAVDELIVSAVLTMIVDQPTTSIEAPPWPGQHRFDEIGVKIAELMRAYASDDLPMDVVFPWVRGLRADRDGLDSDRKAWHAANAVLGPAQITVEDWEDLHLDEQRALVERWFSAIVMLPGRPANRLDPAPASSRTPSMRPCPTTGFAAPHRSTGSLRPGPTRSPKPAGARPQC